MRLTRMESVTQTWKRSVRLGRSVETAHGVLLVRCAGSGDWSKKDFVRGCGQNRDY